MISILKKNEVIVHYRNGMSIREISRVLGIARNTVRSYIREFEDLYKQMEMETDKFHIKKLQEQMTSAPKKKQIRISKRKLVGDCLTRFNEIMNNDLIKDKDLGKNKQHLTASKVHRTLVEEGFDIGETTIRKAVREFREKNPECFIRQEYEYGQRAEYDFHQVKLIVNDKLEIWHQATISCPKSDEVFGRLYKDETWESVENSIIEFFKEMNGVFHEMVFDNMSTVVKRFILNNEKQYTDNILKLSTYYGFKIVTCNPRSGNEKGHVENSGKLTRREFFSMRYRFKDHEELFEYYKNELIKYNKNVIDLDKEKAALYKLPIHSYTQCVINICKVNSYSTISIKNNFYSVPSSYVNKTVIAWVMDDLIVIYNDKSELLAKHEKKAGFNEYSLIFDHFLDVFKTKPASIANSLAFKQLPTQMKELFKKYYSTNPRRFVEIYALGIDKIYENIMNDQKTIYINSNDEILTYSNDILNKYTSITEGEVK